MDKRDVVVTLEIKTWNGISLGATHYYGTLLGYVNGEYKRVDVEKVMTATDARKLNKKDDWDGYRAGRKTQRFDTREDVIKAARDEWRTYFPKAKMLTMGQFAAGGPKEIIGCDNEEIAAAGMKLYALAEKIGWWDKRANYAVMDCISDAWDVLIATLATLPGDGES